MRPGSIRNQAQHQRRHIHRKSRLSTKRETFVVCPLRTRSRRGPAESCGPSKPPEHGHYDQWSLHNLSCCERLENAVLCPGRYILNRQQHRQFLPRNVASADKLQRSAAQGSLARGAGNKGNLESTGFGEQDYRRQCLGRVQLQRARRKRSRPDELDSRSGWRGSELDTREASVWFWGKLHPFADELNRVYHHRRELCIHRGEHRLGNGRFHARETQHVLTEWC